MFFLFDVGVSFERFCKEPAHLHRQSKQWCEEKKSWRSGKMRDTTGTHSSRETKEFFLEGMESWQRFGVWKPGGKARENEDDQVSMEGHVAKSTWEQQQLGTWSCKEKIRKQVAQIISATVGTRRRHCCDKLFVGRTERGVRGVRTMCVAIPAFRVVLASWRTSGTSMMTLESVGGDVGP